MSDTVEITINDIQQNLPDASGPVEVCEPAIKSENDDDIKRERIIHECVACSTPSVDYLDIYGSVTSCGNISLHAFLSRFTKVNLGERRHMCRCCFQLIDTLERAELEFNKLKEEFDAIIAKNPLFNTSQAETIELQFVKSENDEEPHLDSDEDYEPPNFDSDDEPLHFVKRKSRKIGKRKKKPAAVNKHKAKGNNEDTEIANPSQWECGICGIRSNSEWEATAHTAQHITTEVKEEILQNGPYANGVDSDNQSPMKVKTEAADAGTKKRVKSTRGRPSLHHRRGMHTEPKPVYTCEQCDAKYTSLVRFQYHKEKHENSKPPFICEICGAHYKHKKACDIHVALHKGISDWKCEECNKLFPSKGALHRHNNIHTGKLNYQCDLCGKSFIHTSSFKMHKLSHTGMKPHACDICGLALMTRSHLKRHKRIHSGEKRHECAICGKRFSERYNLMAHAKSHESNSIGQQAGVEMVRAPRRRLFRCHFCEQRFERRYMLERHMEVVHQRSLEKQPSKPRNTMTKLLKAQAAASKAAADALTQTTDTAESTDKSRRSNDRQSDKSESRPMVLVLSTGGTGHTDKPQPAVEVNSSGFQGTWSGATYQTSVASASATPTASTATTATDFALRMHFPH